MRTATSSNFPPKKRNYRKFPIKTKTMHSCSSRIIQAQNRLDITEFGYYLV